MIMTFTAVLETIMRKGSLAVIDAGGRRWTFGDGTPPTSAIRLTSPSLNRRLALNPGLALGEAYMDGRLRVEEGSIYDVLAALAHNVDNIPANSWLGLAIRLGSRLKQYNPVGKAQQNVAHHYDLSGALYDLFLDRDRQYSCAYFSAPDMTLDAAQIAKKRHIIAKLLLNQPGLRVLDIGSGWGGMGLEIARQAGANVTGVTLSTEQHKISQARAAEAGLADRVAFKLQDYRTEPGRYDRIVSVGMFEHVGKRNYDEFFAKLHDLMTEDGVALLHSCGYSDAPGPINPFIRKYIFPGADIPSLSEVCAAAERSGLIITDIEILRLHYAETLRCWRERFCARWDDAAKLYDERFCRMWEFYLALCEVGFRYRSNIVFQMQLARKRETVPLTRDYMVDAEAAARAAAEPVA